MVKPPKTMQPEAVDLKKADRAAGKAFQEDSFRNYMARKIDLQRKQFGLILPPDPRKIEQRDKRNESSATARKITTGNSVDKPQVAPVKKTEVRFAPDVQNHQREASSRLDQKVRCKKLKKGIGISGVLKRLKRKHGPGFLSAKKKAKSSHCDDEKGTSSVKAESKNSSDKQQQEGEINSNNMTSREVNAPMLAKQSTVETLEPSCQGELFPAICCDEKGEDTPPLASSMNEELALLSSHDLRRIRPDLFFSGIVVIVNGYTHPDTETLQRLLHKHGGDLEKYETSRVTHIIAERLSTAKANIYRRQRKPKPVCHPDWIVESVRAKKLLPCAGYLIDEVKEGKEGDHVPSVASFFRPSNAKTKDEMKYGEKCNSPRSEMKDPSCMLATSEHACVIGASMKNTDSTATCDSPVDVLMLAEDMENAEGENLFCSTSPKHPANDVKKTYLDRDSAGEMDTPTAEQHYLDTAHSKDYWPNSLGDLPILGASSAQSLLAERASFHNHIAMHSREGSQTDAALPSCKKVENQHHSGDENAFNADDEAQNKRPIGGSSNILTSAGNKISLNRELQKKSAEAFSRGRTDEKYINGRIRTVGTDPNFLDSFFHSSRLSFIGSYKQRVRRSPEKKSFTLNPCKMRRYVCHVDMDCFFAAVALRNFPEHRGKPVAISHHGKRAADSGNIFQPIAGNNSTSECATCNYEARKFGIKKGMYLGRAMQLCPDLVVLHYDFEGYEEVSEQVGEILHRYAHEFDGSVEQVSCDEAYLEIYIEESTEADGAVNKLVDAIREEIFERTQCTATVGVAANKLLAKLGTDSVKPNGSIVVTDFKVLLTNLQLRDLHGIGYRLERKLTEENLVSVKDVWDLGDSAEGELTRILGPALGKKILAFCYGKDDRGVQPAERKTIGAEVRLIGWEAG